jgi:type IV secretory pathway VirB2 component (pilin)
VKISSRARRALLACVVMIALAPHPARADDSMGAEAGLGAASAVCSLLYGPIKVVYALSGLIIGGIAWGLSGGDSDVLKAVITPSVRGDYVITPALLRGERPVEFFGKDPQYRSEAAPGEAAPGEADPVY